MAEHIYDQVVDAIVARLQGLPTTGDRVHKDRDHLLGEDEVCCLTVTEERDQVVASTSQRPRQLQIDLAIVIGIKAKAAAAPPVAAGTLSRRILKEVVQQLLGPSADVSLGGLVKFLRYVGSERDPDEENQDLVTREVTIIAKIETKETSFEVPA